MRLPAKIDYAYKAILELAIRYNGDSPIQLSAISGSQRIPKKFLIQLLLRLKNAKIVNSSRGVAGGYYLTRPPSQISLADVTRAIDDSIIEAPRPATGARPSDADRAISRIWVDVAKDTVRRLENITFEKLVAQIGNHQLTYQI